MDWEVSDTLIPYEEALAAMEARVARIRTQESPEKIWLLEHPPLYTAGTSAKAADLLNPRFPVFDTGRGGQYTYHGPGQRVAYVMLDLKKRQQEPDIKKYVHNLEEWIICTLAHFDVTGERRTGRVGIWVQTRSGEKKIAAIGVRIRHWVTYHGISINLNPDLSHFEGIVPCGISEFGVTSLYDMGKTVLMEELDRALKLEFEAIFNKPA
jgi:lipoyl(octanoyl) transferase